MPWKAENLMELRGAFVLSCMAEGANVSELCRHYGISRKTGYKWLDRYGRLRFAGLADQTRRPRSNARSVRAEIEERIVAARKDHPTWGAGKLLAQLEREDPETDWPARGTVHAILQRHGLVRARRRRRGSVPPPSGGVLADRPNAVWSADFKGQFLLGDGTYCYPLTVMDGCSRRVLACVALSGVGTAGVLPCFESLFGEFGLPEAILTDNGAPFGSSGAGGLTPLSAFWAKLGIVLDRTRPGKPQDNGRHERMHRTLKAATTRPPSWDLVAQQSRFDAWMREYNGERPHEALGQEVPDSVYEPSARRWDGHVPEPEYPGHWETRRVKRSGELRWRGDAHYLSETLAHERVGLFESGEGMWQVAFGMHPVAVLDCGKGKLYPIRPTRPKPKFRFSALRAMDEDEDGQSGALCPHP